MECALVERLGTTKNAKLHKNGKQACETLAFRELPARRKDYQLVEYPGVVHRCSAMKMRQCVIWGIAIVSAFLCGCEKKSPGDLSPESSAEKQTGKIPETFGAALDALDEMTSEEDKQAFRKGEVDMGLLHRQTGMRLRNEWRLWSGSKLKDYFSERGIAHADWISSAIFEGWVERLKTGSVDETAIMAKYAEIEKGWREWSENRKPSTQDEDDHDYPFGEKENPGPEPDKHPR